MLLVLTGFLKFAAFSSTKTLAYYLILLPFEILWPAKPFPPSKRVFTLVYLFFTRAIVFYLKLVFSFSIFKLIFNPISNLLPNPVFDLSSFLNAGPLPQLTHVLMAFFIGDFFYYWWHRLVHASSLLWPLHKMHHSEEYLHTGSAEFVHFLDTPIVAICFSLPITLFMSGSNLAGGSFDETLAWFVGLRAWFWWSHTNTKIHFGKAAPLLIGPQTHRIHHSIEEHHLNKNFASVFPFFDWMFGTYHHPLKDEWPDTGIRGERMPRTQLAAVMTPFREWALLFSKKFNRSASLGVVPVQSTHVRSNPLSEPRSPEAQSQ